MSLSDASQRRVAMSAPCVLVVDDEPLILMVVEAALTEAGYAVRTAIDIQEALTIIGSPDSVLSALVTDIDIAVNAPAHHGSGWDIARYARRRSADLPVVYMTGDGGDEWTSQGVPHSVLILKPFAIDQVVTAVSQLLNRHRAEPEQ